MITSTRPQPRFRIGQLVRHRRYDYRGVVVHVDPFCRASDEWYQTNRTQPNREQPWFHVLVDGSNHVTYAAQSSLTVDKDGTPIDHPLLDRYFHGFSGELYHRNGQPWEGTW